MLTPSALPAPEAASPANPALEPIQERLNSLERSRWVLRAVYLVAGALVACLTDYFGFTLPERLRAPTAEMEAKISRLELAAADRTAELRELRRSIRDSDELVATLRGRAEAAASVAQSALLKAGTLETAVGEAKDAARKALDAGQQAGQQAAAAQGAADAAAGAAAQGRGSAERAIEASLKVDTAVRVASSARGLSQDQMRRQDAYDRLVATLVDRVKALEGARASTSTPTGTASPPAVQARRKIEVIVEGTHAKVHLNRGPAALDHYHITGTGAEREVLVPDDATVFLTLRGTGAEVVADRSLRGRVETVLQDGPGSRLVWK